MRYVLCFSYFSGFTLESPNGISFKLGDTLSIRGTKAFAGGGWPSSLDGVYKVVGLTGAPTRLVVTGSATDGWGPGSISMSMYDVTVSASGGAVISNAKTVSVGVGETTNWWLHAYAEFDSPPHAPPRPSRPPLVRQLPTSYSQPPWAITDPGPPPGDNGNNLDTGTGPFNIGEFIARANFRLGTSAQANNRGAAQFIADATKAAKAARLNNDQTKKLLDAVNKAIAEARAKVKNKPLPKPKGRK